MVKNDEIQRFFLKKFVILKIINYDSIQSLYSFPSNTTNVRVTGQNRYKSERENGFVPMEWGQWRGWKPFFKIRGYKKGTMHFEFLDEGVWMKFNIAVAKAKGWRLPKTSTSTKKARKKGTGVEIFS